MRVLLAMRLGERREAFRLLLESERSDCSVFLADDGRSTLYKIAALDPDVLMLDQILPLLDGPEVLSSLRERGMPCPPKVVFLTAPGQSGSFAGVDEALPAASDFTVLISVLRRVEEKLQGALALMEASARKDRIEALFRELGMPEGLKGRGYLTFLLDLVIPSPALIYTLTARLYPAAAVRFSTTPAAVERCARHAIEATWSRGDMAAIERHFGLSIDPDRGKPTTREFLAMSAQHLRQRALPSGLPPKGQSPFGIPL